MAFKFSHIADCHIGGWRDPRMKQLAVEAFENAVAISIEKKVDFVLIAGDLFNTAIPDIDSIKAVIAALSKLRKKEIPCYFIPGSHDFSPNGKTFLDVIEEADLGINVYLPKIRDDKLSLRFFTDKKTNVKIAGMLGRKGQLESEDYDALDYTALEKEPGFKIFMFHTAITEMKPKELEMMTSFPVNILPAGFDYYAGGHVHIVKKYDSQKHKNVVYPGPLFPNSFSEFEKLKNGSFYVINVDNNNKTELEKIEIELKQVVIIEVNAESMTAEKLTTEIKNKIQKNNFDDAIVLLRIYGMLCSGKLSDIDFNSLLAEIYNKGAYFVMRNTSKLFIKDINTKNIDLESSQDIEQELIKENKGQYENTFKDEARTIIELMNAACSEKLDGEKTYDYESRVLSEIDKVIEDNKNDK